MWGRCPAIKVQITSGMLDWFPFSKRNTSSSSFLLFFFPAKYCDASSNRPSSQNLFSSFVNLFLRHSADIRLSGYDEFLSLLYPFRDVKVCQLIFIPLLFFSSSSSSFFFSPKAILMIFICRLSAPRLREMGVI